MNLQSTLGMLLCLLSLATPVSWAQGLREMHIETFIYTDRDEPVSENITLFTQGKVFDFRFDSPNDASSAPREVAIYDPARKQFQLFDLRRKLRVTISENEILEVLARVSAAPELREKDEILVDPNIIEQMQEKFDPSSGWLTLTSAKGRLVYRAKGQAPSNPDLLSAYCDYIDWYTRLNGTDPRKMPPFARLELNKGLRRHGFIPEQVELVYSPPGIGGRTLKATSKHYMVWKLTQKDQERIESVREFIGFDRVPMAEYLSGDTETR